MFAVAGRVGVVAVTALGWWVGALATTEAARPAGGLQLRQSCYLFGLVEQRGMTEEAAVLVEEADKSDHLFGQSHRRRRSEAVCSGPHLERQERQICQALCRQSDRRRLLHQHPLLDLAPL